MPFLRKHSVRAFAFSLMAGAAPLALGTALPAAAQNAGQSMALAIPAQPVPRALAALSSRTGIQILYAGNKAYEITSTPVSGTYTPDQALRTLLAGTGISHRFVGANAVTISVPGEDVPQVGAGVDGDAVQLETIDVDSAVVSSAGFQGAPDWVYETPQSVSIVSRQAIKQTQPRSSADLFSGMAGVTAAGDPQNPGISVNIRGLQDQNRVTQTIDGARQNYQQGGHGYTSNVYVDPSILRMVEVEKNAATGVGSGGSHGGVVNYRTLIAEDLIDSGNTFGGEIDLTTGTNAYDLYGTASVAARLSENIDIVAALSHKELREYDVGKNGTLTASQYATDTAAVFTGSDTWSGLAKFGWDIAEDQRIALTFVGFDTAFTTSTLEGAYVNTNEVQNLTGALSYTWSSANPLLDLKAQLWINNTRNRQWRSARNDYGEFDVDYGMGSYGGSIENTSRFDIAHGAVSLHYGIEAFLDKGDTDVVNYEEDDAANSWWFTGVNPIGTRWLTSTFANAKYEHDDWLEISAGGRYDRYRIDGSTSIDGGTEVTEIPGECRIYVAGVCRIRYPSTWIVNDIVHDIDVDQSGGRFSPEAMIAVKPAEGIQVFGKYAEGFRPGTLAETLLGGSHIGNLMNYAPNGNLKPETSQTWEGGVNFSFDDLLQPGDKFRMKTVYFDKTVENFIALGIVEGTPAPDADSGGYYAYTNLSGDTKIHGVEIEGNYDAGPYYIGGSFTYTQGDYPSTYNRVPYGGTPSEGDGVIYYIFVAPEYKFTADMGVRAFDENLVFGARVHHVVPAEQVGLNAIAYDPQPYTTLDLYGSYRFNEQASLRFAINNVTDTAYVDPLNSYDFPAAGRTATISLALQF